MRRIACLTCALAAFTAPALAAPAAGTWKGKLDKYTSKLHFQVKGAKLTKFTVPEAPGYCYSGFQAITVYVPSVAIHGGRFSGTHKVSYQGETETIALSGRFTGSTAKGKVALHGPCTGTWTWTAHR